MGGGAGYTVNPNLCAPQLSDTYSCNGVVCSFTVVEPCVPDGGAPDAGADAGADPLACLAMCNAARPPGVQPVSFCRNGPPQDGGAQITAYCGGCGVGRPPRGFVATVPKTQDLAGARLAEMAQLEAASVVAFRALYKDLARLGAPRGLLQAVRAAGEDEVRHARASRRAAARYGVRVPRVRVRKQAPRSMRALAIENAEEGCVKETFGAALAAAQATAASDARVRRMMRGIAKDEMRHAALSWRLATWLDARLDQGARRAVVRARQETVGALRRELEADSPGVAALGLPDAARAREILERLAGPLTRGV